MSGCEEQGTDLQVDSRDDTKPNIGPADLPHSTEDLTRSPCSSARQVAEMMQGQSTRLDFFVVDANGEAVDITAAATVQILAKETSTTKTTYLDKAAAVVDAATGQVRLTLESADTPDAGIYDLQVLMYDVSSELLWVTSYWLAINPALDASPNRLSGMLTMAEIRLKLRDVCAGQNTLLEDFEFNDSQIIAAIRWPIDEFNETNMPKTNYTVRNFPYRYNWLLAACGNLLEIAASGYVRDHLPYSAGGVSVDDKNKYAAYQTIADRLLAQWRTFAVNTKLEINIQGGFGRLRSAYSYYGY